MILSDATRESKGRIQQQGWAKGLGIVDGEHMHRGPIGPPAQGSTKFPKQL